MDPSEYRRQVAEQLQRHAESQPRSQEFLNQSGSPDQRLAALAGRAQPLPAEDVVGAIELIGEGGADPALRAAVLRAIGPQIGQREESIDALLGLLKDGKQPAGLRLEALKTLQMLAFISTLFLSKRPEYLAALRALVEDPDAAVRQAAIEVLAIEKDEYVQRRLMEGLDDPSRARVPPEKAIQLLGQDVHAELYPRLREIVRKPPNPAAREEAIRLLAGDPESRELLVDLLRDRDEGLNIRTLSTVALQSVDPVEFTQQAKQIVLDDAEDESLRITGLTGLTHFEGPSWAADRDFIEALERLRSESASDPLNEAVDRYLNRRR